MGKIRCYTADLDEASRCITQLQNAAVSSEFVIVSKPNDTTMLLNRNQLSSWAMNTFSAGKHLFGGNQINSYTVAVASYPLANKVGVEFNVNFMAGPKAINDLRCTCSVIARDLLNQMGPSATFTDKLFATQNFFRRQFEYRDSGQSKAHSATDLLRSGSGVCQAIATMATILLPFLEVPCLYISGEGFSGSEWGPHGWNAVKMPEGQWIYIDFTFGLNSILFPPSTINKTASKRFLKNHKWDTDRHSEESLEHALSRITEINATAFTIRPNKQIFSMDGITVSAGRQVLRTDGEGYSIDLVFLFRMVGGSAEYIPDRDRLHFVLYDKQAYIDSASAFMNEDGTFDIRILNALPISYSFSDQGIKIRLGGEDE